MSVYYYLSVFPTEALIASQLNPTQFGAYMATGAKKGSAEQIIFIEVTGEFGDTFDWKYAKEQCTPHKDGSLKHSVYLSVYRVLEHIPLYQLGNMYLTTRDGRVLELGQGDYQKPSDTKGYFVYQELCPINPVIVSTLAPAEFGAKLTDPKEKISMPKIIYCDMKVINLADPEHTGNIGSVYDNKIPHLMNCIESVTTSADKVNKTLDRSHVESFSFQIIKEGIYISDGKATVMYRMPALEEIKQIDYDWGRSALLI